MSKGRAVPPKPTFTFSTGVTVPLERVSPMFATNLFRANPAPQPPMAPGVGGDMEPNPADPEYARQVEEHQNHLALKANDMLIDLGVSEDIAIDAAQLARARQKAERYGIPTSGDDRLDYLYLCAIGSNNDLERLLFAISTYTSPTEEAVAAADAAFRSDVGGATLSSSSAESPPE